MGRVEAPRRRVRLVSSDTQGGGSDRRERVTLYEVLLVNREQS
jgi:hypothetical protein